MQVTPLGGGPPDEDAPPNGPDDIQPNLFEFFGFGQPGNGPGANDNNQVDNAEGNVNEGANAGQGEQPMDAEGWGLWPEQEATAVNVNDVALNDNIVVVPVLQQQGEPFLELNDLIQPQNNELYLNVPLENDHGDLYEFENLAAVLDQPILGPQPEDVIDEGAPTDTSSEG